MKLKKAIEKNGKKISDINFNFEQMTGYDIIAAEKEARMLGTVALDVTYSKVFQAVIAAKAADKELIADDILGMQITDFMEITAKTSNFLFGWASPKMRVNS